MNRKWIVIFTSISLLFALYFVYSLIDTGKNENVLLEMEHRLSESKNIAYRRKMIETTEKEWELKRSRYSFIRSSSAFVADLPKISAAFGIRKFTMENAETVSSRDFNMTEMAVYFLGNFQQVAGWIESLELSGLPIQVGDLTLRYENGLLKVRVVIRYLEKGNGGRNEK